MGLVSRVTDSGVVLYEEGGSTVARALQDYDDQLHLARDGHGLWRVYRTVGSEHRDVFICAWQDAQGKPLPLSMGLLEKVRQLDRNTREPAPDPDALNEAVQAELQRDRMREWQALYDDHAPIVQKKRSGIVIPEKPW